MQRATKNRSSSLHNVSSKFAVNSVVSNFVSALQTLFFQLQQDNSLASPCLFALITCDKNTRNKAFNILVTIRVIYGNRGVLFLGTFKPAKCRHTISPRKRGRIVCATSTSFILQSAAPISSLPSNKERDKQW